MSALREASCASAGGTRRSSSSKAQNRSRPSRARKNLDIGPAGLLTIKNSAREGVTRPNLDRGEYSRDAGEDVTSKRAENGAQAKVGLSVEKSLRGQGETRK